jgi:tubulin-folding cofactor B
MLVQSELASSERRISPAWTLAQLKTRLEPITGIPPSCQRLTLRLPGQEEVVMEAQDDETAPVGSWPLQAYAEIIVRAVRATCLPFYGYVPDPA